MEKHLTLPEKIYLLGIHPVKGGMISSVSSSVGYAMIGALLMELREKGNVVIEGKRFSIKNKMASDSLHHFAISKFAKMTGPRRISRFISRLSFSSREIRNRIRTSLVNKGMIRLEERRFLYLFHWLVPVITDRDEVLNLVGDIERQTFGKSGDPENELLLSLILPASLMGRIFHEKHKRKLANEKLKKLTAAEPCAKAVEHAIRAARAAATAAAVS